MSENPSFWKKCSTCKTPIGFGAAYWVCNVTTCNARATDFAFCQINCWDAHLPTMRHKDAWAIEKKAPSLKEFQAELSAPKVVAKAASSNTPKQYAAPSPAGEVSRDILIVASKLKAYVKAKSGMNTSADVMEALSDLVRKYTDMAIASARRSERKTVMARDFPKG